MARFFILLFPLVALITMVYSLPVDGTRLQRRGNFSYWHFNIAVQPYTARDCSSGALWPSPQEGPAHILKHGHCGTYPPFQGFRYGWSQHKKDGEDLEGYGNCVLSSYAASDCSGEPLAVLRQSGEPRSRDDDPVQRRMVRRWE
ncbi:hypothetical protein BAUCODRAFT_35883 [Baudoinia panamericana UAMH 10762]|uniref:Secreted protein n=1 Tax=Baudoinia panamericana (strain UAMH 10762) TaxID=717646 RepID=M2MT02_BAUPA|nr:uncharacterized protein BAUCODRAFT_35883 [Baudoinia panamericana UAMH 10762]EMC94648.1 hypothetical protein BAUCODRAFT_35883 [Baudoinia panamericana UAMH 10762]